jgi:hypothetical protein
VHNNQSLRPISHSHNLAISGINERVFFFLRFLGPYIASAVTVYRQTGSTQNVIQIRHPRSTFALKSLRFLLMDVHIQLKIGVLPFGEGGGETKE